MGFFTLKFAYKFITTFGILSVVVFQVPICAQQLVESESYNRIISHVNILANDSLMGRGTGSVGLEKAARYIVSQMKSMEIEPGNKGSYYQQIQMHGSKFTDASILRLEYGDTTIHLNIGNDYVLYTSGDATYLPYPTPLVFVGYGIIAPEYGYNDYYGLDVQNKIVVYLSGEPAGSNPKYFNGDLPTIYSNSDIKQKIAISQGASGSITIINNDRYELDWEAWKREFSFEDVTLSYRVNNHFSAILHPETANLLFRSARYSLQDVLEQEERQLVRSFPLFCNLTFIGDFEEREFISSNIVGIIRGSDWDKSNEFVLLSAHYDHLGIGPSINGDSIYNGVFDNALGVASVLEIARQIKASQSELKRSVLIFFPTAEEKGLLGTSFFINRPVVPLYKTIAAINIDGVPVWDEMENVIAVGAQYSSIGELVLPVVEKHGLSFAEVPKDKILTESFLRSDQYGFAFAGIPSVIFVEGNAYKSISEQAAEDLKAQWHQFIYHTPFDDLSQFINPSAVIQYQLLLKDLVLELANGKKVPEWFSGVPFRRAQLQNRAERK